MSFICANCHVATAPRIPATLIVTHTRQVSYENPNVNREEGEPPTIISKGSEIVREVKVCPKCAEDFEEQNEVLLTEEFFLDCLL